MPNTPMPWIKLYTRLLTDPLVSELPPRSAWRYIQLLLLAGTLNENGNLTSDGYKLGIEQIRKVLGADKIDPDDQYCWPEEFFLDDMKNLYAANLIDVLFLGETSPAPSFYSTHYKANDNPSKKFSDQELEEMEGNRPSDWAFSIRRWHQEQTDIKNYQEQNKLRQAKHRDKAKQEKDSVT